MIASRWAILTGTLLGLGGQARAADVLDLSQAVIVAPSTGGVAGRAVAMLAEELASRTGLRPVIARGFPARGKPAMAVGLRDDLARLPGAPADLLARAPVRAGAEGYTLVVDAENRLALVAGNDPRGVLFGVGRLLRTVRATKGRLTAPPVRLATTPRYPLRGHQMGYRPKTNSYDGWSLPVWERYVRDLVLFGTNAVELLPPRTDDEATSPHFPQPPRQMLAGMSRLLDRYGLDVWLWYPAIDQDYGDPKTVAASLDEWGRVFATMKRLDALFVPAGDPGRAPPGLLMALVEKQAANLRRHHPRATVWIGPQSYSAEHAEEFYALLAREPAWLTGVVYGPEIRISYPEFRRRVPARYPIRHYPDITHTYHAQFPVPDWDPAFALTLGREPINPRPLDMAHVFRSHVPGTAGFITYSEGCNDDVNKIVWSALGWDDTADVRAILREYARVFLGPEHEYAFAEALVGLERNWRGPLLANTAVDTTLRRLQELERTGGPRLAANWRFQQALYRAYYDAAVRTRLIHEAAAEQAALARLREGTRGDTLAAIGGAERLWDEGAAGSPADDLVTRVTELGDRLFRSIRMQLSVPRHQAVNVRRGANLDTLLSPLNDRLWWKRRLAEVRSLAGEPERQQALSRLLDWASPGPGGFYDDLGDPADQPHLVRDRSWADDPGYLASPFLATSVYTSPPRPGDETVPPGNVVSPYSRLSTRTTAETHYDVPIKLRYDGLDPGARYRVRVIYGGDQRASRIKLMADGHEVVPHDARKFEPIEADVPAAATADGALELVFTQAPGSRGNGRGNQVAEVWLLRAP